MAVSQNDDDDLPTQPWVYAIPVVVVLATLAYGIWWT
jgi:hypothetical protein